MPSIRRPPAEHPDAKLVIRSVSPTLLEVELHTSDGETFAPFGTIHLEREPEKFFKELFSEIEGLSVRHRTSQGAHREMEDLGAELSKRLLPLDLGHLLTQIPGRSESEPRTLWIQSDEPWIPWELLRLPSSEGDRGFQGPFLGEAFAVARWLRVPPTSGYPTPGRSLPLNRFAVVAPQDRKLDSVEGELAFLGGLRDNTRLNMRQVERIPADEDSVRDTLARGGHDAWHFSGHGLPNDEPTRSEILFGNNQCLRSRSLYAGMLESRPLVFLNACHTGLTGFSLTGIGGWAEGFLSAGAGAFLGAYWAIEDAPAARFAKAFYTAFLEGMPIAASVRHARLVIRDEFPGDPTWLAYTLYAHPLAIRDDVEIPPVSTPTPGPTPASVPTPTPVPTPSPSDGKGRGEGGFDEQATKRPEYLGPRPRAWILLAALVLAVAGVLAMLLWPRPLPSILILNPVNHTGTNDEHWRSIATSEILSTALTFDGSIRSVPASVAYRRQLELGEVEWPGSQQAKDLFRQFGIPYLVHGTIDKIFRNDGSVVLVDIYLRHLPSGREVAWIPLEGSEEEWRGLIFQAAQELRRKLWIGTVSDKQKTEVMNVFPKQAGAMKAWMVGLEELWKFDYKEAREALTKAAGLEPENALIQSSLATAAWKLGDLTLADEASEKAYNRRRDVPRKMGLKIAGKFHEIREDWPGAVGVYQEMVALYPRDPESTFRLIEAYISGNKPCRDDIEKLRQMPLSAYEHVEVDLLAGDDYYYEGDMPAALEVASRAVNEANNLGLRYQEARARMFQAVVLAWMREYGEAIKHLESAMGLLQMEPKNQLDFRTASYQWALNVYWEKGVDAAWGYFDSLSQRYRDQEDQVGVANLRSSVGVMLTDLEFYQRAEEALDEALQIYSRLGMRAEIARAATNLGAVHQYRGQLQEARERYIQAKRVSRELELRGDFATVVTNLGEVAFLEGDLGIARGNYQQALKLNEDLGVLQGQAYDHFRLGLVWTAEGKVVDARGSFEMALELIGEDPSLTLGSIRLALAEVMILEENLGSARELFELAETTFKNLDAKGQEILARLLLAQTYLDTDLAKAQFEFDQARVNKWTYSGENRRVKIEFEVMKARLAIAGKKKTDLESAMTELGRLAEETQEVPYLLGIRLTLARVHLAAGLPDRARLHLLELELEARQKGFDLIAAVARKLLASADGI